MVHIVGAGCGAPDLITLRGKRYLEEADVVIYAGSLVNEELLSYVKESCELHNSAKMTLEEILAVISAAETAGKTTVRLHSGDTSLYGAIAEQIREFDRLGISYDITPGVSSFAGAAAALKTEYTLPSVSQTVIISRAAGKTPVPEKESLRALAAHQATMVLFLSISLAGEVQTQLIEGGYPPETPASILYKISWEDEKIFPCTVGTIEKTARENGIRKTALIVVGDFLESEFTRSHLYDGHFSTEYREAKS